MKTLVIAPHPDDEMLGAGGTLARRKAEGAQVAWVIVTKMDSSHGWSTERIENRVREIEKVSAHMGFDEVYELGFPTTRLDTVPMGEIVAALGEAFRQFEPEEIFVPHPGDVHSDHAAVFRAAAACTKWFRYPSVRRVLAYETLSETEFGLEPGKSFTPNLFVNIEGYLQHKLAGLAFYENEFGLFPFPRCVETVQALAALRGSAAGFGEAEAFQLLRERH